LLSANRDRLAAALAHEASHDPLTGVLNRRAFTELLGQELRSPYDLTVIFCDIDDFKLINDRLGHVTGDRLLIEIARRIQGSVREQDPVGRFGGDEFLVLLPECGADRAALAVERVHGALTQPLSWLPGLRLEASLGAVVSEAANRDRVDVDALIRGADEAMYSHKQDARTPSEAVDRDRQIMVW
jgi:diguanylate cyclase (GGDEF)-like protein